MKYLGGLFLLFLLWVMIFLVLVSGRGGGENAAEIDALPYFEFEYPLVPDEPGDESERSDPFPTAHNYAPEREDGEVLVTVSDLTGDEIRTYKLEEYLVGTVFAEMPSRFELEALKAQAVAARSYCYYKMSHRANGESDGKHPDADVCGDFRHCKAYMSYEEAVEKYGEAAATQAFEKCRAAVEATKGEIIVCNGEPALAVFHAMSASFTESAANVWGSEIPYLISAPTPENAETENIFSETVLSSAEVMDKLTRDGYVCDPSLPEPSVSLNDTGRVGHVTIFGAHVPGTDFRRIFSLRSADFEIRFDAESEEYTVYVRGYGHGVGLSQHGANLLALDGLSYRDILFHYYNGIAIFSIEG